MIDFQDDNHHKRKSIYEIYSEEEISKMLKEELDKNGVKYDDLNECQECSFRDIFDILVKKAKEGQLGN